MILCDFLEILPAMIETLPHLFETLSEVLEIFFVFETLPIRVRHFLTPSFFFFFRFLTFLRPFLSCVRAS